MTLPRPRTVASRCELGDKTRTLGKDSQRGRVNLVRGITSGTARNIYGPRKSFDTEHFYEERSRYKDSVEEFGEASVAVLPPNRLADSCSDGFRLCSLRCVLKYMKVEIVCSNSTLEGRNVTAGL